MFVMLKEGQTVEVGESTGNDLIRNEGAVWVEGPNVKQPKSSDRSKAAQDVKRSEASRKAAATKAANKAAAAKAEADAPEEVAK